MKQVAVHPTGAPAPVGPYSPAITWENLIFVSGQGPLDPDTGTPIQGDIIKQTERVFANIDTILQSCGSSRNQILKVTVYLSNINDFQFMNKAYAEYFKDTVYPARTTIQAGALPGKIDVEIDVLAYRD